MIPVRPEVRAKSVSLSPSTWSALRPVTFLLLFTFSGGWFAPALSRSGVPLELASVVTLVVVFFLPTDSERTLGAAQAVPLPITRAAITPTAMPAGVTRAWLNQGRLNTMPPLTAFGHRDARAVSSIRLLRWGRADVRGGAGPSGGAGGSARSCRLAGVTGVTGGSCAGGEGGPCRGRGRTRHAAHLLDLGK